MTDTSLEQSSQWAPCPLVWPLMAGLTVSDLFKILKSLLLTFKIRPCIDNNLSSQLHQNFIHAKAVHFILFKKWFYLFIFRERGSEGKKRGRETSMWERNIDQVPLALPQRGPGPPPSHVSWLGIELVTFWFMGWCPVQWASLILYVPSV